MRKRVKGRKFNRKRDQRRALLRSLAEALVRNEHIETTETKAKELRPYIERWVTKSANNSVQTRRLLRAHFSEEVTNKLLEDIGPRYKARAGGYTRIIKRGHRVRDNAPRAIIEFVREEAPVAAGRDK